MKYPKEIASDIREQTFYICEALAVPGMRDNEEPLRLHHPTFSRFDLCVINKEKKAASYYILATELPALAEKSRFCFQHEMKMQLNPVPQSPAYAERFRMGKSKGKTPAELAIEEGIEAVEKQRDYLVEAMRKNPKYDNSRIIAACEEAVRLAGEGRLNLEQLTRSMKLYNMDFPHANPYRKSRDQEGKYLTRQMKILWNFGMDEPVEIRILNCYCPISKAEGTDLQIPLLREASDVVKNTFSMSADKWMSFIDIMEANKRIFEDSVGPSCRKNAADADKANRQSTSR